VGGGETPLLHGDGRLQKAPHRRSRSRFEFLCIF
jgi:hypothetical protein